MTPASILCTILANGHYDAPAGDVNAADLIRRRIVYRTNYMTGEWRLRIMPALVPAYRTHKPERLALN
jgi:hypothetical protein